MKIQRYFCLLLFCLPLLVYAQSDKTVTVSYERSAKGEVTFYSETQSHTPYTVSMTFSRLSNTTSSEGEIYDAVIHYGKTRLLTLRPSTENVPIGFSYRYTYKKGNSRLKTDTSFVYLFPLAQGKVVRVNKMVSLDNFMGKEGEKRITGLGFSTTAGDTIFAARGGLVKIPLPLLKTHRSIRRKIIWKFSTRMELLPVINYSRMKGSLSLRVKR